MVLLEKAQKCQLDWIEWVKYINFGPWIKKNWLYQVWVVHPCLNWALIAESDVEQYVKIGISIVRAKDVPIPPSSEPFWAHWNARAALQICYQLIFSMRSQTGNAWIAKQQWILPKLHKPWQLFFKKRKNCQKLIFRFDFFPIKRHCF